MENDYIKKHKDAIINLANVIYKSLKSIIIELWNKLKNIVEQILVKDKKIKKRINISNRTKSIRIYKKQQKIIVRGMQVYFI